MYGLQAVIAAEHLLTRAAHAAEGTQIVPLRQSLALLPMTDAFFDAVTSKGLEPRQGGFWKMPAGFERTLTAWSTQGPVAYVEADYVGGTGEQRAQVWDGGGVVLGPLHSGPGERFPAAGSPISQALRRLGAGKGNHCDEFDAIALGRRRETEAWLDLG
ncbi:hypothetical protein [Actinomadura sp. HBU206391]|uniref:hypothetical protein n=1 Tax=Actinomadura sp. HBU206391 TaxID=2731692 RepID=UPI00164FF1BC|nr:hypothetical protein [Actinomadura sp. HBU206391]MBC6462730.1 hypothetical protein [Actinomadura sp. HBU206391]